MEPRIFTPSPIDFNDRGHRLRSGSLLQIGVTGYELSLRNDVNMSSVSCRCTGLFRAGAPDCFVQVHQSQERIKPGFILSCQSLILICLLTSLCNQQEIINRRLNRYLDLSDTILECPGGPLFESDSNKRRGAKTGPLFESPPRPLLKSGLQLLGRCGTHQETISRRPEQVYLPSDPRLEWPGEGPFFEFNLNKCWGQNVFFFYNR